jgi:hypothetical protein
MLALRTFVLLSSCCLSSQVLFFGGNPVGRDGFPQLLFRRAAITSSSSLLLPCSSWFFSSHSRLSKLSFDLPLCNYFRLPKT